MDLKDALSKITEIIKVPEFAPLQAQAHTGSGLLTIDFCFGKDFIPCCGMVEIFGEYGVGKTLLARKILDNSSKTQVIFDADLKIANKQTCAMVVQSDKHSVLTLILSNTANVGILVDSFPSIVRDSGIELSRDERWSLLEGLSSFAQKKNLVILTNQLRTNPVKHRTKAANSDLHQCIADVRLKLTRIDTLVKEGDRTAIVCEIEDIKNSCGIPVGKPTMMISEHGIDIPFDILQAGLLSGVLSENNYWIYLDKEQLCRGFTQFKGLITSNEDIKKRIVDRILGKIQLRNQWTQTT